MPVCHVFSTFFVGKKQHRNIFSHKTGQLAKFGWILTYLKIQYSKIQNFKYSKFQTGILPHAGMEPRTQQYSQNTSAITTPTKYRSR